MITEFSELSQLRKSLDDKKIVFAGGTFDLYHPGHVKALENLKKFGDVVIIALSTDKRIKERKGPKRPILSEEERLLIMDAIKYVDYCLIAPEPEENKPVPTMRILTALRPDVFVSIDKRWLKYRKEVEDLGVQLKIVKRIRGHSTTKIISRVVERYCE